MLWTPKAHQICYFHIKSESPHLNYADMRILKNALFIDWSVCTIKSNLQYIDQINHRFITVWPFHSYSKRTKHFFSLFRLNFSELSDLRLIWTSQLKWDFQIRSEYANEREGIDRLISSHRDCHWAGIRNPLSTAIANNELSLLKLQQVLIGFKVIRKTTRSIIIKLWCRHVRASRPGAATGGAGLHLQGAGGWGPGPGPGRVLGAAIHPLTAASEQPQLLKTHQPDDGAAVSIKRWQRHDDNVLWIQAYYPSRCWLLYVFLAIISTRAEI